MSCILYNGDYLTKDEIAISFEDRGYYFGDGVYEVFRIYNGKIYEKEAHLHRLQRSAAGIQLTLPHSLEQFAQMIEQLKEKSQIEEGTLYLQVTRGIAPRSHLFPEQATPTVLAYCNEVQRPLKKMRNGIHAITLPDIRWLRCDLKTLNLLPNTLAKQTAAERGVDEAILHRNRTVTECSASNLMIVKNGTIITHPANELILHGITRQVVLRIAEQIDIPYQEEPFSVDDLHQADEVFITGTTVEIMPITVIDSAHVGTGTPGPIVRQLQEAFERTLPTPVHE